MSSPSYCGKRMVGNSSCSVAAMATMMKMALHVTIIASSTSHAHNVHDVVAVAVAAANADDADGVTFSSSSSARHDGNTIAAAASSMEDEDDVDNITNVNNNKNLQSRRNLATTTTNCGNTKGWHAEVATGNQDGCSNDNHHPDNWGSEMFFSNFETCCRSFFPGGGCVSYDACGGSDGDGDSGGGGGGSVSYPDCAWHADMKNQDGCSNDDSYPKDWLDPIKRPHMFHTTPDKCCQALYSTDSSSCKIYDVGCTTNVLAAPTAPAPTAPGGGPTQPYGNCVSPGWHADMSGANDGCTNDDNYPGDWLSQAKKDKMFFTTPAACCNAFFPNPNASCKHNDRGCSIDPKLTAGGCDGPLFVPDDTRQRKGCTNNPNYPKEWKGQLGVYEFDSARACCTKYHDTADGQCAVTDGCTGRVEYLAITKNPTARPTNTPTPKPTRLPTKFPTNYPTYNPTIRPPEYYIVHGVGTCVNDKEVPRPHYTSITFSDIVDCCHYSFAMDKCMAQLREDGLLDESEIEIEPPTVVPTMAPLSDVVVDITMYGTLQIGNLAIPSEYNSPSWGVLKNVLSKTITSVMAQSPISHPLLIDIELTTFGSQSFPSRRRRRLEDNDASPSETVKFTMTVPTRCDETCQLSSMHYGKLAFNELQEHLQNYIETGVASSTLEMIGQAYGLIADGDDTPPFVSSGSLTYQYAVASSVTWIPTFMPTIAMPTSNPTDIPSTTPSEFSSVEPTSAPTTAAPTTSPTTACSSFKWHFAGDGECTNSQHYPRVWDTMPELGSTFLYDTIDKCCAAHSLDQCIMTDTCGEYAPVVPSIYCDMNEMLFHPTTPEQRVCTNSEDYPMAWDNIDRFLFVSAAACCEAFYSDYSDGPCYINNVCY